MPYSQGSIFVAGASAQIGDVEQGNFPTAFAALGSAVAPLRADYPTWFFDPPVGYEAPVGFVSKAGARDAHHEELPALHYTKVWMARFDKKV